MLESLQLFLFICNKKKMSVLKNLARSNGMRHFKKLKVGVFENLKEFFEIYSQNFKISVDVKAPKRVTMSLRAIPLAVKNCNAPETEIAGPGNNTCSGSEISPSRLPVCDV